MTREIKQTKVTKALKRYVTATGESVGKRLDDLVQSVDISTLSDKELFSHLKSLIDKLGAK